MFIHYLKVKKLIGLIIKKRKEKKTLNHHRAYQDKNIWNLISDSKYLI